LGNSECDEYAKKDYSKLLQNYKYEINSDINHISDKLGNKDITVIPVNIILEPTKEEKMLQIIAEIELKITELKQLLN
jgi:hypothetical protein